MIEGLLREQKGGKEKVQKTGKLCFSIATIHIQEGHFPHGNGAFFGEGNKSVGKKINQAHRSVKWEEASVVERGSDAYVKEASGF